MFTRLGHITIFALLLATISACAYQRGPLSDFSVQKANIPVFIEIPKNDLVFENISPLIYDVFSEHFEQIGYQLMTRESDGYTLRIMVKSLDPSYKYVSPDIVLFNLTIRLNLFCQLLNYNKDVVASKDFAFTTLVSKPQNPVLNSDFLDFEYTRLLKKAAPKVEQYFRPFLFKSVG